MDKVKVKSKVMNVGRTAGRKGNWVTTVAISICQNLWESLFKDKLLVTILSL